MLAKVEEVRVAAGNLRSKGLLRSVGPLLSDRASQVMELRAAGHGLVAIAEELEISIRAVERHITNATRRLGVPLAEHIADDPASDNCGVLALALLRQRTGNHDIDIGGLPGGLAGITHEQLQNAIPRARLHTVPDHDTIAGFLRAPGLATHAVVVDNYTTADRDGFGAHAYLISIAQETDPAAARSGRLVVNDPAQQREHAYPPQPRREISSIEVVYLDAEGHVVEPPVPGHAPTVYRPGYRIGLDQSDAVASVRDSHGDDAAVHDPQPTWVPLPDNGDHVFEFLAVLSQGGNNPAPAGEIRAHLADLLQENLRNNRYDPPWQGQYQSIMRGLRDPNVRTDGVMLHLLPLAAREFGLNIMVLRPDRPRTILRNNAGDRFALVYLDPAYPGRSHIAMGRDGNALAVSQQEFHTAATFEPPARYPWPPATHIPHPGGPGTGYVDHHGIRQFDTDAAGLEFGEWRLNLWHELTPAHQHAVWAYDDRPMPNVVLREDDYLETTRGIFAQLQRSGRSAELLSTLTGPGNLSLPVLAQWHRAGPDAVRRVVSDPDAARDTWERLLSIMESQSPSRGLERMNTESNLLATVYGPYFERYFGMAVHVDALARQVELLDQATRRPVPIAEPIRVTRGLRTIEFLRGRYGRPPRPDMLERLVGSVHREPGYLSTSVSRNLIASPDGSRPFRYRLDLTVPVGAQGLWIGLRSGVPGATELLLARDTRYRITAVRYDDAEGIPVFDAEILLPTTVHPQPAPEYR